MKNRILLLLSVVFAAASLHAQEPLVISGTHLGGLVLREITGSDYHVTDGAVLTFTTDPAAVAAIVDRVGAATAPSANWFIRNSGTIGSPADGNVPGYGIYLVTTGSSMIINEESGFIRGNNPTLHSGAVMNYKGGFLTLINAGEIRGYTPFETYDASGYVANSGRMVSNGRGVFFYADDTASVFNPDHRATVVNSGEILATSSAPGAAVRIDYDGGLILNVGGTIQSESATAAAIAAHIDGKNVGANGLIENTAGGLILGEVRAVYFASGGTLLNTSGTIASAQVAAVEFNRQAGTNPVVLYNGPDSLIRGGTAATTTVAGVRVVAANAVTLDNAGVITGHNKGVLIQASTAPIFINNRAGAVISNTVANAASTTLLNNSAAVILATGVTGTITNAGLIEGRPFGLYLGSGVHLVNTGTILGSGTAIFMASSTANSSLTLAAGSSLGGAAGARSKVINTNGYANAGRSSLILTGSWRGDAEPIHTDFLGTAASQGFVSLAMNGTGEVRLMGQVSLQGGDASTLAVNSGTLVLSNTISFYRADISGTYKGAVTVAPGAALTLADGAAIINSNTGNNAGGITPKINVNGSLVFNRSGALDYTGVITGAGSVTKQGAGTVTLSGSNSYGDTIISAGTLVGALGRGSLTFTADSTYRTLSGVDLVATAVAGASGAIVLEGGANLVLNVASGASTYDFGGSITGGGSFVKTGSGALLLSRAIALSSAAIRDGVVRLDDQAKIGGAITLGGAGTRGLLDYTGAAAWTKNLALDGTGGGFTVAGTVALSATVTGAGDFVKTGSGTLDATAATLAHDGGVAIEAGTLKGDTAVFGDRDTAVAAGAVVEFYQVAGGTYAGVISGSGALLKTGSGALDLAGANTYGDTTVRAGLLSGNAGRGTLAVESTGTYRMGAGSAVTLAGILGNGTVDLNGNDLVFDVAEGATGAFNFQGTLSGTAGSDFIKTGAGTLELARAVSLASAAIRDGTVRLDDEAKIGGALTLGGAGTRGLLDYTGTAAWTKNLALAGAGGGLSIGAGTVALGAAVTGTGDFVKAGAGTLDLTGASMSYAGNTRVDGGLLRGDTATIRGDTAVAAGAVVEFYQVAGGTYAGVISGSGALLKTGAGALDLAGANTYGATVIEEGALIGSVGSGVLDIRASGTYRVRDGQQTYTAAGITGAGTLDLNQADLLFDIAVGGTGTFSFTGGLAGASGSRLLKTGAGVLELLSRASLPGGASIENGVVRIASPDFLNAPVSLGGAATEGFVEYTGTAAWTKSLNLVGAGGGFITADADAVFTATATGDGAFIKEGARALDITGATFANTGGMIVRSGTLKGDAHAFAQRVEVKTGAVLAFHQSDDDCYDGIIAGAGAFLKTGSGVLTLTRPVEFTGPAEVSGGVVRAGASNLWLGASLVSTTGDGAIDMGGYDQRLANLSNNGAIIFNADVNAAAGVIYGADSLVVTGSASGTGKIRVRLNEVARDGASWSTEAVLFEFAAGDPAYTAEFAGRQVAGAYDWTVRRDGSRYLLAADQLSPEVPAVGGIDAAGYLVGQAALDSLNKRLMASRRHAEAAAAPAFQFWADGLWREDRVGGALYDRAKARTTGFQAGADWNNQAAGGEHFFTLGIFYGQAEMDLDLPGKTSSTNTASDGWGLYGGWQSGPLYVNALIRVSDEDYEIFVPGTQSFRTDGSSRAAALEVGVKLPTGWAWNIEPQAGAVVQKHKVSAPADSMGRSYAIEAADALAARAGVRIWRDFSLWGGKFSPYARASVTYDWDGRGAIRVAGLQFDDYFGGSTGALDAGTTFALGRHFILNLEGGWYAGAKLDGYGFNAAAAWRW